MEEIINIGSTATASCPGVGTQEEVLDNGVDMDEEEVECNAQDAILSLFWCEGLDGDRSALIRLQRIYFF